jgi:hypothetical protein
MGSCPFLLAELVTTCLNRTSIVNMLRKEAIAIKNYLDTNLFMKITKTLVRAVVMFLLVSGVLTLPLTAANTDWLSSAKYGLFVHYLNGYNQFNLQGGAGDTSGNWTATGWDKMVGTFNYWWFAQQANNMGVKYVIFSVGQTSGFYCSPNSEFNGMTGTLDGQYCSSHDLIGNLATSLNYYGIKLIVYINAEGPTNAPASVKSGLSLFDDRADGSAFRLKYNKIISKWSTNWGTKVAGWWLDGCYVNGYTNSVNGKANLDALINACRAGNPNAIVACNPGSGKYAGLTDKQDYLAGEDIFLSKYPFARFLSHPSLPGGVSTRQFLLNAGNNMPRFAKYDVWNATLPGSNVGYPEQWHTTTFLGSNWGKGGDYTRFTKKQIASYINNIAVAGGALTLDVVVGGDGTIAANHYNTFVDSDGVKGMVSSNSVPNTSGNLAQYKSCWMMSNVGFYELEVSGWGISWPLGAQYSGASEIPMGFHGPCAVDEVPDSFAEAANEWAWNLMVELGANTTFRRVKVNFPGGLNAPYGNRIATRYAVYGANVASSNPSSWTQLFVRDVPSAGTYENVLSSSVTYRYIKVQAITPNAENQLLIKLILHPL